MANVLVMRRGECDEKLITRLETAGVIVVESDRPECVRLLSLEHPLIGHSDILYAAISALDDAGISAACARFVANLRAAMKQEIEKQGGTKSGAPNRDERGRFLPKDTTP